MTQGGEAQGAGAERARLSEGFGERPPAVTELGQQDWPRGGPNELKQCIITAARASFEY